MPDLNHILEQHRYLPYLILLVWTFLEGETIVIIAGIAARDGNLWLPLVILCAFCGSILSDQLMFFLGRFKGAAFIARRPAWQLRAQKVYRLLERYQTGLILGFRFLYGVRNITPFALGMSEVSVRRFVTLNILGAALWAVSFAWGGYLFGAAIETVIDKRHRAWILLGLLVLMCVIWVVRLIFRRRNIKRQLSPDPAAGK
jgi:membrane protein DedA with SNARE-associated domain